MASGSIVARERELEAISSFLDLDLAGGRALLLQGEAGIGKTALWRAGTETASARGYRVLACSAAESETKLAFTTVRDLLSDAFDEVEGDLPQPQRQALAVVLLREEPPERAAEPATVAVAFLTALRVLASRAPTLVAVDDVQWLDPDSADVLRYGLRRLGAARVDALLTRRAAHGAEPFLPGAEVFEVGPFSVGALGRILRARLDVGYPRGTLQRVHAVSGGNPFYALEIARAIGSQAGPHRPDEPLPVPNSLLQLVRDRVASLPAPTFEALAVASALSRPTVGAISAALDADAMTTLEPAVGAEIVKTDGTAVWFTHPLFPASVYELMDPSRRSALHGRLAAMVDDVEERAHHLALATDAPDEEVASAIEAAARRTRVRGDRVVSAQLFRDAARLTPQGDVAGRARRLLAGAGAMFEAGDSESAQALLEQVVGAPGERNAAAEARWRLGTVLAETGPGDHAMRLWQEALELADDPSLAAEIQRSMAVATIYAGGADAAVAYAEGAVAAAEASADAERLAFALSMRALTAAVAGDSTYRSFVARALALESTLDLACSAWSPSAVAAECALLALDVEEAERRFPVVLEQAVETGNVEMELWAAHRLATTRLAAGDSRSAHELAGLVLDLAQTTGVMRLPAARLSAELDAHFGRVEEARDRLEAVVEEAEREGWGRHLWLARIALGALHLACGDADGAANELLAARHLADQNGIRNPAALVPLVDEVEAAAADGRTDQAQDALAATRSFRDAPPWADPLLLRSEAAVLAGRDELEGAEGALARACAHEAAGVLPLQRARTLLALGSVQRRMRRRRVARDTLERALEAFEGLGAAVWAERAREDLARIPGRPPAHDDLTPSERRIAALVAEGKTNKEVAAILVVAERTVESALTQIYRKLGVRSRTELTRRLTSG